ncbi:Transketolase, pyridine binding domain protein [Ostertagia ostertagi]
MNVCQAVNSALHIAMETDKTAMISFENLIKTILRIVRFGSVGDRFFNTPLCEQGIVGFGIGVAVGGSTAIAEVQFSDYIFPAYDQLVNEAAKYRYRSGGMFNCGALTVRSTYGAVGHGGLYHSQSPEAHFTHTPALRLLSPVAPFKQRDSCCPAFAIRIHVYFSSLSTIQGSISNEQQKRRDRGLLQLPSVEKTGRLIVTHEAPITSGFGAEIAAAIQRRCFLHLESPIERVCGFDTPFPHVFEPFYLPTKWRLFDAIKRASSTITCNKFRKVGLCV